MKSGGFTKFKESCPRREKSCPSRPAFHTSTGQPPTSLSQPGITPVGRAPASEPRNPAPPHYCPLKGFPGVCRAASAPPGALHVLPPGSLPYPLPLNWEAPPRAQ